MKRYVLLLTFLISAVSNAQDQPLKYELNLSVVSLFNFTNPHVSLGFYQFAWPKVQIGIDCGFGGHGFGNTDVTKGFVGEDYIFYNVEPEIRFYIDTNGRTFQYLGAQMFYAKHTDLFVDDFYIEEHDQEVYMYERATYKRIKYGANFTYGLCYNITKNFGLIQHFGLGLRQREVYFSDIINPLDSDANKSFALGGLRREGSNFSLNTTLDLKVFYKF